MPELEVIRLNGGKAFPIKSRPRNLSWQWLKEDGDPVTMVPTWTGEVTAEALWGTVEPTDLGNGSVQVTEETALASYAWHDDDFSVAGVFRLVIWAGNTIDRYGSPVFEWAVADAPGADPAV